MPRRARGRCLTQAKRAVRKNALKHGALSAVTPAEQEDLQDFENVLKDVTDQFDPQSAIEAHLVQRLALLIFREVRLARWESRYMSASWHTFKLLQTGKVEIDVSQITTNQFGDLEIGQQILIGRYQTMLNRQMKETLAELRTEQEHRVNTLDVIAEREISIDSTQAPANDANENAPDDISFLDQ